MLACLQRGARRYTSAAPYVRAQLLPVQLQLLDAGGPLQSRDGQLVWVARVVWVRWVVRHRHHVPAMYQTQSTRGEETYGSEQFLEEVGVSARSGPEENNTKTRERKID